MVKMNAGYDYDSMRSIEQRIPASTDFNRFIGLIAKIFSCYSNKMRVSSYLLLPSVIIMCVSSFCSLYTL